MLIGLAGQAMAMAAVVFVVLKEERKRKKKGKKERKKERKGVLSFCSFGKKKAESVPSLIFVPSAKCKKGEKQANGDSGKGRNSDIGHLPYLRDG